MPFTIPGGLYSSELNNSDRIRFPAGDDADDSDGNGEGQSSVIMNCTFEKCNKVFSSRWSLKRHIRTHTGEKPFSCDSCGKQFVQKCSLNRHEQTHTADKAWVCDHYQCNKKFKLKEYLDVHKRTHLRTGEDDGDDDPIGIGPQNSSHVGTNLREQLRHRLVRLTLRFRTQLGAATAREENLKRKLAECQAGFLEAVTLLNAFAPDRCPPHLNALVVAVSQADQAAEDEEENEDEPSNESEQQPPDRPDSEGEVPPAGENVRPGRASKRIRGVDA
jgi:hypothetical protein